MIVNIAMNQHDFVEAYAFTNELILNVNMFRSLIYSGIIFQINGADVVDSFDEYQRKALRAKLLLFVPEQQAIYSASEVDVTIFVCFLDFQLIAP